jgi:hypothetical protein
LPGGPTSIRRNGGSRRAAENAVLRGRRFDL